MALFGIGKNKKTEKRAPQAKPEPVKSASAPRPVSGEALLMKDVLVRPRVTEKAASLTSVNVYTFDVRMDATKHQITKAIKTLYKVTPVKVNVVNTPAKRVRMRRKRGFGRVSASRKAYVYLKKGDSITIA